LETLKKFINLQNKTIIKLIDTNKKPSNKIQNIYTYIFNEMNNKINSVLKAQDEDYVPFQKRELIMAGGCLTEMFLKDYQGEEKGYVFYISDRWLGNGAKMTVEEKGKRGIPYKSYTHRGEVYFEDILDELFGGEFKAPTAKLDKYENFFTNRKTYEFIKEMNEEKVEIQIILLENQQLNFDLAIREFYYQGETILASSKALRDIENNEITINSIKSPLQTCFRLKEFEKRYNMKASKVEKEILMQFIKNGYENGERRMIFKEGKMPEYHSEKRMEEILTEIEKVENWNEIYTKNLHKILCSDLLSRKCSEHVIFERIRMMKECNFTEEQLSMSMVIDIPKWTPEREIKKRYEEIKERMIEIIEDYNKKNKIKYIYRDKTAEWLKSEVNIILSEEFKEGMEQIKLFRIILLFDETVSEKNKILCDETSDNKYFFNIEKTKEIIENKKIDLKISVSDIYTQKILIFNRLYTDYENRKFFNLEFEPDGVLQVSPKYKLLSKGMKFSFINDEREQAIREKISDFLLETEDNELYTYI
jgi:hypothetical protein